MLCDDLERWNGEWGGRGTRERGDLIQVVMWQKPTQLCKACILQLKKEKLPTEKGPVFTVVFYQMFKEELIPGFGHGPVVKSLPSNAGAQIPGQRAKIPHVKMQGQKMKIKEKTISLKL